MNSKIIEKLEYNRIIKQLSDLAITVPAKEQALTLMPSSNFDEVKKSIDQTRVLSNVLRVKGPMPITDFKDVRASLKRLKVKANLNGEELGNIFLILSLAKDVSQFTADLEEREIDTRPIEKTLKNLAIPEDLFKKLNQAIEYDGTVKDTASSKLMQLRHDIQSNETDIKNHMNDYISGKHTQYLSENIVTIRDGRYVLPVKQEYKNKFGGVVHDQSASGQTLFVEPQAVLVLNNRQQNLMAQERQEIHRILIELSELAGMYQKEIKNNADALTQLDFLSAKSKLAKAMKATEPVLNQDHVIKLRKARHPLIDPKKVVPNNIELGTSFDTMLITGPNTGGKTITLKTLGLLQLMAQAGLFITAEEGSQLTVFNEIYADIGDEQSIEQSLSTFSSHMDQIIKIMKDVTEDDLVLIDELGAGTDPEEGASLAIAILDDLRGAQAKIAITTHYPELKLYGYNRARTTNASMEFDLKKLAPTYRLRIGIPGQSNAFAIAHQLGMNEVVVDKARSLMNDEDSDINKMIERLTEQTKAAEQLHETLKQNVDQSITLKRQLQNGLDWYNQQVQKQLEKAQEKADEMLAKKRQKADKIINDLEEQRRAGGQVRTNKVIEAKGALNKLERENQNLAQNKVLQREKRRHDVSVGDTVKVLSYGQQGVITKKLADHEFEVQIGILKVKVTDRDVEKISTQAAPKKAERAVRSSRDLRSTRASSELDLRGQRYEEALTNLDRYIDSSLLAGLNTVTIIHGIGTGAIRNGVQQYLKRNRHVKSYSYAPANQGGTGATIVYLQ
ncbi:endonuclease MutS2 [Lactobacillus johnsonii]|uniref:Endonuclease MutS2 n=1 Tax=Lactobacillus johnsonii (strain CNCM I-12250 / La1 / NCC 533) TaxID=257314 RepID=MUTS2_LACJO|nr:endonuclease MutS2 [Lactobacillus johnsonii]Q74KU8.1 RecName: Full=Endonuclease MutS2 [Lactobacillus johnsonii NCC 533]AAS08471.1 DNA mismatch repair protein MutS [Lactobacillus johnsonii NCC 533]MCT3322187.1 endonuclease MutS2 [Lactobacillus johnsonii]MCT3340466.1 endonuclease MutS2 [Lactobacillus johnsonii]MCT3388508.1 endonuclease MutS2 [Lactobacillus johnsonii]